MLQQYNGKKGGGRRLLSALEKVPPTFIFYSGGALAHTSACVRVSSDRRRVMCVCACVRERERERGVSKGSRSRPPPQHCYRFCWRILRRHKRIQGCVTHRKVLMDKDL